MTLILTWLSISAWIDALSGSQETAVQEPSSAPDDSDQQIADDLVSVAANEPLGGEAPLRGKTSHGQANQEEEQTLEEMMTGMMQVHLLAYGFTDVSS